jgi:RHS repeat-associated protein
MSPTCSLREGCNVILPGQVFDGQAGPHQNGYRDFDPAVGSFLEPDPTGLTHHMTDPLLKLAMRISTRSGEERDPGLNFPYAYVGANPVSLVDPQGADRYDRSTERPER